MKPSEYYLQYILQEITKMHQELMQAMKELEDKIAKA